jgi:hypothetical protein
MAQQIILILDIAGLTSLHQRRNGRVNAIGASTVNASNLTRR